MSGKNLAGVLASVLSTYGRDPTPGVLQVWLSTLRAHPEAEVVRALERWTTTERKAPVPADILALLDPGSAWPSADEAWAVVAPVLGNEHASVVWCAEMARAAGEVEHLDPVAGRMAFRAAYERLVAEAKRQGGRPSYYLSPGWSPEGHETAVREASIRGWLPAPDSREGRGLLDQLRGHLLEDGRSAVPAEVKRLVDQLRGH